MPCVPWHNLAKSNDRIVIGILMMNIAASLLFSATVAAASSTPVTQVEAYTTADIKFISDFVCPETFHSQAEYDASLKNLMDWVKTHHPTWTVGQLLEFRVGMLELHSCSETLEGIRQSTGTPPPPDLGVAENILPVTEQTKDCIRPEVRVLSDADRALLDSARTLRDKAETDKTQLRALEKRAESGDHVAEFYTGSLYDPSVQPGVKTVAKDWKPATDWYMKAALAGLPEAEYSIGNGYANGNGVTSNTEQAVHWYELAAKHGYVSAAYNMALSYDEGIGVSMDEKKAQQWYCAAAMEGDDDSRWQLAAIYFGARGVSGNTEKLNYWLGVLAEEGNDSAKLLLEIMKGAQVI